MGCVMREVRREEHHGPFWLQKSMNRCDVWQSSTHSNETVCVPESHLKEGKAESVGRTKPCVCNYHNPNESGRAGRGVGVLLNGVFGWPQPGLQVVFSQVQRA